VVLFYCNRNAGSSVTHGTTEYSGISYGKFVAQNWWYCQHYSAFFKANGNLLISITKQLNNSAFCIAGQAAL